jgi:hypothetical protein
LVDQRQPCQNVLSNIKALHKQHYAAKYTKKQALQTCRYNAECRPATVSASIPAENLERPLFKVTLEARTMSGTICLVLWQVFQVYMNTCWWIWLSFPNQIDSPNLSVELLLLIIRSHLTIFTHLWLIDKWQSNG